MFTRSKRSNCEWSAVVSYYTAERPECNGFSPEYSDDGAEILRTGDMRLRAPGTIAFPAASAFSSFLCKEDNMNWQMAGILVAALVAATVLYIATNVGVTFLAPILLAGLALAWLITANRRHHGPLR